MFYFFLVLGTLFEVLGDVLFRKQTYILGGILYLVGSIGWALTLRYETLSKAIVLNGSANVLLCVFCGVFWLGETLTFTQYIGIVLGLVSMYLLR